MPPIPDSVDPGQLSPREVDELLELRLIAKLATVDERGRPHLVSMWFRRDGDSILMPTSLLTKKIRNLRRTAYAAVLIDQNRSGLDLRGVHIRGRVELVEGRLAHELNHSVHLRYVTEPAFMLASVAEYLGEGDDVTIRIHMDRLTSWNLAAREVGRAVLEAGHFHPLDA